MKTNFLCGNVLPRGAGVFLKFGFSVMVLTFFYFSGYAQTSSTTGERQHLYLKLHKNDPNVPDCIKVKPLSDDDAKKFSYGYYSNVNTETATLRLFEDDDIVAPDGGTGFHAQLTLMSEVPSLFIRFGVSVGEFNKTYSLNNSKLFYNKGHVEVSEGRKIDIYYDGNAYQVTYDDVLIECDELGSLSGLRQAFVSSYNRTNTGGEVNFMLESYTGDVVADCVLGCQPDFVGTDKITPCTITEPNECPSGKYEVNKLQGNITAYPNPVSHQLTVNINTIIDEDLIIRIIDARGRTVQLHPVTVIAKNDNTMHVDVSDLSDGVYYIKIDSEYQFETQKITIIK